MQHRAKWSGAIATCVLAIAGCATDPAVRPWWTLRESDFLRFKPGESTKEEVRKHLGTPFLESRFPRRNEEVWDYRFLEGSTMRMYVSVFFGPDGRFRYYVAEPDPALYNSASNE